jgi:hypothetical protein
MDATNKVLVGLIVFFGLALIVVDKTFNGEGEVFQVYSTLLSSFSAALITRITGHVVSSLTQADPPPPVIPPPGATPTNVAGMTPLENAKTAPQPKASQP